MEQDAQHKIEVLSKRRCSKSFSIDWIYFQRNLIVFICVSHHFCKTILGPKLQPYIDWSRPLASNRHTFQLVRRCRKRQLYHQKWKTFMPPPPPAAPHPPHDHLMRRPHGGYAILWELEKVDRQIHTLQLEISVLKQQLKIAQTCCLSSSQSQSQSPLPSPSPMDSPSQPTEPNNLPRYFIEFFVCLKRLRFANWIHFLFVKQFGHNKW